jgi:4-amino-4-deoxy-L-arabinose transferase-like glycosyltransferase
VREQTRSDPASRTAQLSAGTSPARLEWAILAAILALALVIRLIGIQRGLPYVYYTDEAITVNHAVAFGTGDLNPHNFTYPTLYMYVLAGVYGVIYAVGRLSGSFGSVNDFVRLFFEDATPFYLPGRLIAALAGVATIAAVYAFGRRTYDSAVGLTAALFLSVSVAHARWSHYVKAHVPAGLFVVVVLALAYSIYRGRDGWRRYLLAGLVAGLGASTIYHAGFALVSVFVAHVLRWWEMRAMTGRTRLFSGKLVVAVVASAAGFLLGTPFALLDWRTFFGDLTSHGAIWYKGQFWATDFLYPFSSLLGNMGYPLGFLALAGLVYALVRRRPRDLIVASQPLFLGVFFLFFRVREPQHMLIAYPALAILAASLLVDIVTVLVRGRRRAFVLAAAALLVSALPALASFRYSYTISLPDTRTIAKDWIEKNLPPASRVVMDSGKFYLGVYGPPLRLSRWTLEQFIARAQPPGTDLTRVEGTRRVGYSGEAEYFRRQLATQAGKPGLDVVQILHDPGSEAPTVLSLDEYRRMGVQYAILSSYAQRGYGAGTGEALRLPEKAKRYRQFYESVESEGVLLKEFRPSTRIQGPILRVYKVALEYPGSAVGSGNDVGVASTAGGRKRND